MGALASPASLETFPVSTPIAFVANAHNHKELFVPRARCISLIFVAYTILQCGKDIPNTMFPKGHPPCQDVRHLAIRIVSLASQGQLSIYLTCI